MERNNLNEDKNLQASSERSNKRWVRGCLSRTEKEFSHKIKHKKKSRCTFHRNQDSQLYHGSKFAILTMIGLFYVLWESFCA